MAQDVFGIVGSVVAGAYQVEKVVAEGGFAVVYRAHHAGFRAPVALKCLKIPQQLGAQSEADFLEQFRAEAELLFRLSSSITNIVRPLHVDAMTVADGSFVPFMALEWLEGETLEALVRRRQVEGRAPFSLKKLVRLLTPVARALEKAHNFQGPDGPISIVHRDLKPENIYLAKVAGEDVAKILDFGIGKAKTVASQVAGRASASSRGDVMDSFTPAYGAPEQWLPKRFGQTGPWTDVWGLALTMVEVLAARPIIDGDHAAMMGTALDEHRRPTPRTEGVDVTDSVEAVFRRALALDPRERHADAGLYWDDLLQASGVEEVAALSRSRDRRREGGVVPREERIEAVAPRRASRPNVSAAARLAPTEAAPASGPPGLQGVSPFGTPLPVRPSQPEIRAPEIPDLDLGPSSPSKDPEPEPERAPPQPRAPEPATAEAPPPSAAPSESKEEAPPSSGPVSSVGNQIELGPAGSGPGLELDLAPGERITSRSSPDLRAVTPPGSRTQTPSNPRISGSLPAVRPPSASGPSETNLGRYLMPGGLIAAGILVTVAGQMYASSTGEVFSIGPLSPGLVAGPLVLAGIGLLVWRLVTAEK